MNAFEFLQPRTLDEALAAGATPGAAYLAGGTNLVDLMKAGVARPGRLVHLGRLEGLDRIETLPDGGVRIGALVRNADLEDLAATYPLVVEATLSGASAQLRHAATVGGNLMQRTRCAYFFDPVSACNKRNPGAGCDMARGETRGAAVLGASAACVATHPSDLCVALVALDAVVEIAGPAGRREMALEAFYRLPGDNPAQENELGAGELIVALRLPPNPFAGHSRYIKARDRVSYAFALASAAAALKVDRGVISQARVALGGVALKPWRSREAEAVLQGAKPSPESFAKAADAALADAKPVGDNGFKIELARRVVKRALTLAAAGTGFSVLPASPFGAAR